MERHRPEESPEEAPFAECDLVNRPTGTNCFLFLNSLNLSCVPREAIGQGRTRASHLFSVCIWAPFQKPHGRSLWANIIKSDSLKCYRPFGNAKCYLKQRPVQLSAALRSSQEDRGQAFGWTCPRQPHEAPPLLGFYGCPLPGLHSQPESVSLCLCANSDIHAACIL